jgi:hypothetical protein
MMMIYIVHDFQGIKFNQITPLEYVGHIGTGTVVDLFVTGKGSAFPWKVLIFFAWSDLSTGFEGTVSEKAQSWQIKKKKKLATQLRYLKFVKIVGSEILYFRSDVEEVYTLL